jgi:hypothetical protein
MDTKIKNIHKRASNNGTKCFPLEDVFPFFVIKGENFKMLNDDDFTIFNRTQLLRCI